MRVEVIIATPHDKALAYNTFIMRRLAAWVTCSMSLV